MLEPIRVYIYYDGNKYGMKWNQSLIMNMLKSKFMTWYGSIALSILVPSYILTHIVSIIHMRILIPSCISERIGSISLYSILSIGSIIHIRQCCFHKCIGSIIHIRGYWFHLAFWTLVPSCS